MTIKIHKLATKEFDEAVEWYEIQQNGLGKRFRSVVVTQIKKIKKNANWFLTEDSNIYKIYIPKFPFKILYTIENTNIIIWAFAHLNRNPLYWQSRIENNPN